MIKLVLYDARDGSSSRGRLAELFLGDHHPLLVHIPHGVLHGFKSIGHSEALVINVVSRPYDHVAPDERRYPAHDPAIPYDWTRHDR
jgi:dTDP-4-dehydrorhamnose 3,5-epimerase